MGAQIALLLTNSSEYREIIMICQELSVPNATAERRAHAIQYYAETWQEHCHKG
jgi:hypothetical protein